MYPPVILTDRPWQSGWKIIRRLVKPLKMAHFQGRTVNLPEGISQGKPSWYLGSSPCGFTTCTDMERHE